MHKNQAQANKNWETKNKEHSNYLKSRGAAKSFIRNKASIEDIEEFRIMLVERENQLKDLN